MIILNVKNLSYKVDNKTIIDDINLSIEQKSLNAVLSSNNSCKTTLIKLLSGILIKETGKISVNNIDLNKTNFKKYIVNISTILSDIENGKDYPPPMHLRDAHYKDASKYGFGIGYIYSHDAPEEYQQFLPDEIKDRKYLH